MSSDQIHVFDCSVELDKRLLGVGLTSAEAELGLCQDVVCVPDVWSQLYELGVRDPAVTGRDYFEGLRFASVVLFPTGLFEFAHNLHDQHGAELATIVPLPDERGRVQTWLPAI